jgi:3-deoxy-D-manno-octulosonic-acid transferase
MLRVLAGLRRKIPDLRLVIVPRHAERAGEVANEIARAGFACVRRSGLNDDGAAAGAAPDVLLVDTTGELRHYYPCAEAVFVGKSLTSHGGQNIVEACFSGRPVVVGPHMENFPTIVRDFLDAGGIVQVRDEAGLAAEMGKLLESPALAGSVGRNAIEVIRKRAGTVARGVDELIARIPEWNGFRAGF